MPTLLHDPHRPAFASQSRVCTAADGVLMRGRSWHPERAECPPLDALVLIHAAHVTFAGAVGHGELVVARELATDAVRLLAGLYALGFPLASLRPIDAFGGDDDASMAANNSSGFNFRTIAGTQTLSNHARGRAIDLNPVQNPWLRGQAILPAAGAAYLDRAELRPGMIVRPSPVSRLLDELGWQWGGDWLHARDLHHIQR